MTQTNPEQWAVELLTDIIDIGGLGGPCSEADCVECGKVALKIQAAFAEREAQHRETLAVLQTAHESEVMMQAKIDRLADLLAKACGDIAALLVFGNREGDIRSWTAEYAEALNEHDATLKDRTHG